MDVHLKGVWKHCRLLHTQVCLKSSFYTSGTAADFLDEQSLCQDKICVRSLKRVINTTFLYDLNLGAGPDTVPEWGMHWALFTGSLRATLTVHTLCFAIFLQTREKKPRPEQQRCPWGENGWKRWTKFVYSRLTLGHHTEEPFHLIKVQHPVFLFFTFLLFSEFILDSKK